MGGSRALAVSRAASQSPKKLFKGKKNGFALLRLESGCLVEGAGAEGSCSSALSFTVHTADTPQYPSAVQIRFSCLTLLARGRAKCFPIRFLAVHSPPTLATVTLGIHLEFDGVPGLDFFLACFTWALSPLHNHVVYYQSLEWFCCCRCWRAANPPSTHAFSFLPSPGDVLHHLGQPQHLLHSPLCSTRSLTRITPALLQFLMVIKMVTSMYVVSEPSGPSGHGLQAGEALKFCVHLKSRTELPHHE